MNATPDPYDYKIEFYNSSSTVWFSLYVAIVSLIVMISDVFFMVLVLSARSLRNKTANWYLIGLTFSDFLQSAAHVCDAWAMWTNDEPLCARAGFFVVTFVTSSVGFPPLIAAHRYYKISALPEQGNKWLISKTIFNRRMTIPLIVGWFCFAILSNVPLLVHDAYGEDPAGFCGARKFVSVGLLLTYETTIITIYFASISLTAVYYYHLSQWLKRHQMSITNQDSVNFTKELMRVMKLVTIIPVVMSTPVATLSAGQMLLPRLPMWLTRLLTTPHFISTCLNPWITICFVRPFRSRFLRLIGRKDAVVRIVSVTARI